MDSRVPPHDSDAERAVLAAVLDPEGAALAEVVAVVRVEDFYDDGHRVIFAAALELDAADSPINILTVTQKLKARGELQKAGGPAGVSALTSCGLGIENARHQAAVVADLARRRRIKNAAQQLENSMFDDNADVDVELAAFDTKTTKPGPRGAVEIGDCLTPALEHLESLYRSDEPPGVPTGMPSLDRAVPLSAGDLIVLAGRTGMGKTALGLTLSLGAAVEGRRVCFVSLEMPKEQVVNRAIAQFSGVRLERFRSGRFQDEDWPKLTRAAGELKSLPLLIDDSPGQTVAEIKSCAAKARRKGGLDLLVIDHLGKIRHPDERASEYARVTATVRATKDLARALGIPVVLLSQLSRQVEQRMPPIPAKSDLRDSGAIEEEADTVLLVYRQDYYVKQGTLAPDNPEHVKKGFYRPELDGGGVVLVAKNRHGPEGKVPLCWTPHTATFSDKGQGGGLWG